MIEAKSLRSAGALMLAALLLSGCSVFDEVNLFGGEEDVPLPGQRVAALGQDPLSVVPVRNANATISAATAVDWSQPGGNAANNPGNVSASIAGAVVWRVDAGQGAARAGLFSGASPRTAARPIIADGAVVTLDPRGTVAAFDLSSGAERWRVSVRPAGENSAVAAGGVAAAGGRIFVATPFRDIVALDPATGGTYWTARLDAPGRSAPTAAGGRLFVVTQANSVYALDQATGAVLWRFPGLAGRQGLIAAASPAVSGDTVIVPFSTGEVVAISASTGRSQWAESTLGLGAGVALSALSDAAASPVIVDGTVYLTGAGGLVVATGLSSGARLWQTAVGSAFTPVVSGNAIFLLDLDDRVVALNRQTGAVLWGVQLPVVRDGRDRTSWSGPVLANGLLYFVDSEGQLISVSATNGAIGAPTNIGVPGAVQPIIAGGRLVVFGADGTLAAVN